MQATGKSNHSLKGRNGQNETPLCFHFLANRSFFKKRERDCVLRHVKDVVRRQQRNTGAPQTEPCEARGGLSCILVPKLFEWGWRCSLWARHQFSHPTFIRTTGNINITEFFLFFPLLPGVATTRSLFTLGLPGFPPL